MEIENESKRSLTLENNDPLKEKRRILREANLNPIPLGSFISIHHVLIYHYFTFFTSILFVLRCGKIKITWRVN